MNLEFLIIDLFAGAGGVTTGFDLAVDSEGNKIAKVIAAVNHDPLAIQSHWKNHPDVLHFEEDIRTLDLTELVKALFVQKSQYPNAKVILWASLECTNFSKAKGGQPRDADSRTLADHLERYIVALDPDYVMIENVVEFMSWGPLDENGKPLSKKNGIEWIRWKQEICSMGYYDEWTEMNSADFGAYTSRNRLFGCFAKHGLPIAWPEKTHSKVPEKSSLFRSTEKWKPVREVLDLNDEGESIFSRKKPLVENTLKRVYAGLIKYVAGEGKKEFLAKYYSGRPMGKVIPTDGPTGAITTVDGHAYVKTVFLTSYYSSGDNNQSIENPSNTIVARDNMAMVQAQWIDREYNGEHNHSAIDTAMGVIPTVPKANLVTANKFIVGSHFEGNASSLDNPLPTITANRKYHYIVNPGWIKGNVSSVENPCPVIIARQDKTPLQMIVAVEGMFNIPIYEDDSETMILIKQFMAMFGIVDIKMRMLRVRELLMIQGFPKNYKLLGNQNDQKKFIGNSVVPHVVKAWIEALNTKIKTKIAA